MHFIAYLSLCAALLGTMSASAQVAPASAASAAPAPNDRAQRDADKVYRMILMHADKPRRAANREDKVAAPAPAVASAPARSAGPAAAARAPNDTAPAISKAADAAQALPAATAPAEAVAPVAAELRPAAAAPTAVSAVVAPAPVAAPTPEQQPAAARSIPSTKSVRLELVDSIEPEFPSRLVRSLGSGSVVVQFDVRPDGTVSQPEVVRSSHRGLNAAAVAAVAAWRFKPISETAPGVVELKFE